MKYVSPYEITNTMLEKIETIMKKIGKLENYKDLNKMPILRKNNRIHSIHSSLAIEANSLSFKEVKDIINGKLIIGPKKEIQEVKNAYKAYEMIKEVNPYSINNLKKIHGIMTYLIVEESGNFRECDEGVFDGDKYLFIAPKPELVENLITDLFTWMKENKDKIHPLILSSIFHYEFVFIHPFSNENGRIARLWQNIILSNWEEIFEYIPIELQIKKYQNEYYTSINNCNQKGNSTEFIEFMLKMIDKVLDELIENTQKEMNHISTYVNKLLNIMEEGINYSPKELMEKLNFKSRISFKENFINPALDNGFIKMTIPNAPRSKNQRYYKV